MGAFEGHALYGTWFFLIGLWHLIDHIKLHAINPKSYTSLTWFPFSSITRHLELYFIMVISGAAVFMELFLRKHHHHPLDPDGTIPTSHLHNFEHAVIALSLSMYAFFAMLLDRVAAPARDGLTNALAAVALDVELLMFHLHSADHMGVEGQYHFFLQILIFTSLFTTILSISYRKSFLISFLRSLSILFQGVWLVTMGFMLWTPKLIPKGCFMNWEPDGFYMVRCRTEEALERAKSLVNILFSYYVVGLWMIAVTMYLLMVKYFSYSDQKFEYNSLNKNELEDFEAQKKGILAERD